MAGLTARFREASAAARSFGLKAALEAFLLGPERFRILTRSLTVEPMLQTPVDPAGLSALERRFASCSDIYAHLPTLYKTTVDRQLRRVLELGTRMGESTIALLAAAREISGHVTSVDAEPCPETERRVREAGLDSLWTFILSDDLALDWKEPIDHLFIDTSHTYEHTLRELQKYEPFVVPGGIISMHDTTSRPEVWRAIEHHFRGRRDVQIFRYFHNNGLALVNRL